METLVSKALIIQLSLQPAPASEISAFNNIRAFGGRRAGLLPASRIDASSRSRFLVAQPHNILHRAAGVYAADEKKKELGTATVSPFLTMATSYTNAQKE